MHKSTLVAACRAWTHWALCAPCGRSVCHGAGPCDSHRWPLSASRRSWGSSAVRQPRRQEPSLCKRTVSAISLRDLSPLYSVPCICLPMHHPVHKSAQVQPQVCMLSVHATIDQLASATQSNSLCDFIRTAVMCVATSFQKFEHLVFDPRLGLGLEGLHHRCASGNSQAGAPLAVAWQAQDGLTAAPVAAGATMRAGEPSLVAAGVGPTGTVSSSRGQRHVP